MGAACANMQMNRSGFRKVSDETGQIKSLQSGNSLCALRSGNPAADPAWKISKACYAGKLVVAVFTNVYE